MRGFYFRVHTVLLHPTGAGGACRTVVALLALVTVLVTVLVMVFCSWGAVGVLLLLLVLQSKAALGMGLTVF